MTSILEKVPTAQKICPVVFLLDSSESMEGEPIGTLNNAVENLLPELSNFSKTNSNVEVRMAILSFNSEATWLAGETALLTPEQVRDAWQDLQAKGMTSLGEGFKKLNEKLNFNSEWFRNIGAPIVSPLLILFSDGEPTDDYRAGLKVLRENRLYKIATRIAIGYGKDANKEILQEFTRNIETVFKADSLLDLQKLIKLTTVTSLRSNTAAKLNDSNAESEDTTPKAASLMKAQGLLDATGDEKWDELPA